MKADRIWVVHQFGKDGRMPTEWSSCGELRIEGQHTASDLIPATEGVARKVIRKRRQEMQDEPGAFGLEIGWTIRLLDLCAYPPRTLYQKSLLPGDIEDFCRTRRRRKS